MYEYMYSCKHEVGRACGRAWMYMTACACVRSYVCMYVCIYVSIRVMCVWGGGGRGSVSKSI